MIRTIWAVGRNYLDHIKELGNAMPGSVTDPGSAKAEPMIFIKAGSSVVANGRVVRYPSFTKELHYETELAVRLVIDEDGQPRVDAFTVALDLTARDVQSVVKAKGQPWELAKSFIDACPLGDWVPISRIAPTAKANAAESTEESFAALQRLDLSLRVNGELRQQGQTKDMIFSTCEICNYLVSRFPVQSGDVLLTGSPAGVGPIVPGDALEAEIVGLTRANWQLR